MSKSVAPLLLYSVLGLFALTAVSHGQVVDEEISLTAQADRCRRLLETSVVDFYLPASIDQKNGGYHQSLGEDGKFKEADEKFLTFQARQVWFFSNMANNLVDRMPTAAMAEHGFGLLQTRFLDKANGGYFLKIKNDGSPTDDRKHVYPLSFVIYSLVELHRITDNETVLKQAVDLFDLLEKNCYDQEHGGYYELYTSDWKKISDTDQWGVVGAVGFKTYNSHLHLLEAYTQLYLETDDKRVGKRLEELLQICTKTIRHPEHATNVDAWSVEWKMVETQKNLRTSYGHDLECAWLVLAAADAIGKRDKELEKWAVDICDNAIKFGHDEKHGGFFYTGPVGKASDDRKKEWWTQSEALVGVLTCFKITGDQKYLKLFNKTLDFIEKNHVADQGGWYASLKEDGSLGDNKSRSSMWQGAYHNGRALMMCETMLRSLANPGPDFSSIDSMEKAKKLVKDGTLEKILLLPIEFGGKDIPPNVVYAPVGLAKVKSRIDKNIIGPLVQKGSVGKYSAEPSYSGDSVIPNSIKIKAWEPGNFSTDINIWGDTLKKK